MNKKTKGAIAAGAAALILAGGAGTFATWSDTKDLTGGSVTSGHLAFSGTATGDWYKGTDTSIVANKIADIATFRIVPGQTLTYKATADFLAEGTNLNAKLELVGGNTTDGIGFDWEDTVFAATGVDSGSGVITPSSTTRTATVTKSVTFDATGIANQGKVADLTGLQLKLTQTS
ncbi:alternate signal-mediated exported protein [Rhodococcus sp. OK519]|uniref:alternate-type signal peptide domain-containing protein n=1 Tax=Rhodococcus sp. OK519 TaxID=2135729 RepID=UPI000D39EEA9|nr:alternate signal-mediated exported protein [Rhodococcus sp. OK519]